MLLSSFNKAGVSVFILEKVASSCFPVHANLTSSCVSVSHFKGILTDLRSKLPSLAAYGVYLVARSLDSGVQPFYPTNAAVASASGTPNSSGPGVTRNEHISGMVVAHPEGLEAATKIPPGVSITRRLLSELLLSKGVFPSPSAPSTSPSSLYVQY